MCPGQPAKIISRIKKAKEDKRYGKGRTKYPGTGFYPERFQRQERIACRFCRQRKCSGGFQPGLFLTILPQAHGAVAPRLSKICKTGYGNYRCRAGEGRSFPRVLGKGRFAFYRFARSRTSSFEIVRPGGQTIQVGPPPRADAD